MKKESGFSFIEVMIAILLLSIIIAGSSVIPSAVRNLRSRIETTTAAINLAAGVVEDYRNQNFDDVQAETTSITLTNGPSPLLYPVTYTVTTAVSGFDVDASGALTAPAQATDPDVKNVTVTVTWVAGGKNGQTQMSALLVLSGQGEGES